MRDWLKLTKTNTFETGITANAVLEKMANMKTKPKKKQLQFSFQIEIKVITE